MAAPSNCEVWCVPRWQASPWRRSRQQFSDRRSLPVGWAAIRDASILRPGLRVPVWLASALLDYFLWALVGRARPAGESQRPENKKSKDAGDGTPLLLRPRQRHFRGGRRGSEVRVSLWSSPAPSAQDMALN